MEAWGRRTQEEQRRIFYQKYKDKLEVAKGKINNAKNINVNLEINNVHCVFSGLIDENAKNYI